MKKIYITLGIALVALTTAIWAQEPSLKEGLFQDNREVMQIVNVDYQSDQSKVEMFIHRLRDWMMPVENRGYYEAPEVSMSFFFENAEVVYEKRSGMEAWMEVPFEEQLDEELVSLENWMTLPFKSAGAKEVDASDVWTAVPVEGCLIEDAVRLETWMTAPFENELAEETLALETWMTDPFEEHLTEEPLGLEDWMTRPFDLISQCNESYLMATSPMNN